MLLEFVTALLEFINLQWQTQTSDSEGSLAPLNKGAITYIAISQGGCHTYFSIISLHCKYMCNNTLIYYWNVQF